MFCRLYVQHIFTSEDRICCCACFRNLTAILKRGVMKRVGNMELHSEIEERLSSRLQWMGELQWWDLWTQHLSLRISLLPHVGNALLARASKSIEQFLYEFPKAFPCTTKFFLCERVFQFRTSIPLSIPASSFFPQE